jgi:enoyl-CoA hydratase/carnithine racemase
MTNYEHLAVDERDGAAVVRLDRPEKRNALNERLIEELSRAMRAAEDDEDVRAVVLTGEGSAFCSGYDLSEPMGEGEGPPTAEEWMDQLGSQSEHIYTAYELDVPVVAAVNGPALAGGSDLALVCDLTIANERAEFGYPAVRMGGLTATLTYPFVMDSLKHARELLYSGKVVDAETAEQYGMVNRTVPHEDLLSEAMDEVAAIRKVPRPVVTLTKGMLNGVQDQQGFRPSVKNSEFIAALSHMTEGGQRFHEIKEEEGLNAAFEWMYEAYK